LYPDKKRHFMIAENSFCMNRKGPTKEAIDCWLIQALCKMVADHQTSQPSISYFWVLLRTMSMALHCWQHERAQDGEYRDLCKNLPRCSAESVQEVEYFFDIVEAMCDAHTEFYWFFIAFFELIFQMVFMPLLCLRCALTQAEKCEDSLWTSVYMYI
jgi:hypothetical protein